VAELRVVFLTTSWPRNPADYAGRFVADLAERMTPAGVAVRVVAPGVYRDFGLAGGDGILANARRRPWLVPPLLASMALAVREAAREADLVHVHWLQNVAPALAARRPLVLTLHGSDVAVASRAPAIAGPLARRARVVLTVSESLAASARSLGTADARVVRNGVDVPETVGTEADPPEVLYVGRLAPEKGVEELAAAASGLNLAVVGDGPLRPLLPGALGFLSREEVGARLDRAAVVVCPSRREGFGLACAEAMAHGRPVVATAVGGLAELVVDGETGILVEPGDPEALRAAIDRLLADPALRRKLGEAGRERIRDLCDWDNVVERTLAAYEDALGRV
jgi:glycosyltransferase involved in cell wall biosynthesis